MSQSGDSGSLKISSYEGKQLASQDDLSAVTRPDLSGPAPPKLVHTPGEAVLANLPVTSSPSPKLEAGLRSPEAAGTILRIPRVPRTGYSPVEAHTVSPSPKIRVRQDLMNHLGLVASTKPSPVSASPSLTVTSTPSALDSLHLGLASLQPVQAAADPEPRSPAPCDSSADSTSLCPSLKILQSDVTVCLTRMTISQDSCRETTWPLLWITFPFTPRPHPSSRSPRRMMTSEGMRNCITPSFPEMPRVCSGLTTVPVSSILSRAYSGSLAANTSSSSLLLIRLGKGRGKTWTRPRSESP